MTPLEIQEFSEKFLKTRDKHAYEKLFDYFAPRITAHLRKLGLNQEQAEELMQEVMLLLWRKIDLFDPTKSTLSTWLYRIARNRRIDLYRKEKKPDFDPYDPSLSPQETAPPDLEYDITARDRQIRKAISQLPPEQMETIKMAFFEGCSHSKITEKSGLPVGTVKSRIRLAFSKLKRMLEEDERVDIN